MYILTGSQHGIYCPQWAYAVFAGSHRGANLTVPAPPRIIRSGHCGRWNAATRRC